MRLIFSVIGLALTTIRENKARSILTVLGVVIGTGTIIAVGSILAGFDGAITGTIRSFGTNTVFQWCNDTTTVCIVFRVGTGHNVDIKRQTDFVATDLYVALFHNI